jgi:hypothetical protein
MSSDNEIPFVSNEKKVNKTDVKSNLNKTIVMLISEFIGTAFLVFFGCMGCIDWIKMPGICLFKN